MNNKGIERRLDSVDAKLHDIDKGYQMMAEGFTKMAEGFAALQKVLGTCKPAPAPTSEAEAVPERPKRRTAARREASRRKPDDRDDTLHIQEEARPSSKPEAILHVEGELTEQLAAEITGG